MPVCRRQTCLYLSALANSAALLQKKRAYIVWGIDDVTHSIVGTSFTPRREKVGNEALENWLSHSLNPRLDFRIHEFEHDGKHVVIFEVPPATSVPVRFKDTEYIRVGSYKKKLKDYPEKERTLWYLFRGERFEDGVAAGSVSAEAVLELIDYPSFFSSMKLPLPENREGILKRLEQEKFVRSRADETFDITNIGAILFARQLNRFDSLARKALRVIIYKGTDRTQTIKEHPGTKGTGPKGYAVEFEELVNYINDQLPYNEEVGRALRKEVRMYPEIAVRELVANAIIHQDFTISGTGPMVEIFTDRIEITNPGTPLIDTLRFIDEPPRSRNEALAAIMRRLNICEERGSGIDKVIAQVE
ncbi:MAG: ATP-binding protein, partial [bacterium]